jgi:RND family efflux transporter MFP subunit
MQRQGEFILRKKWMWRAPVIITLAMVLLLSGCGILQRSQEDQEEQEEPPVAVTVIETYIGEVEVRGVVTGLLQPESTVGVVHKTGGKVSGIYVNDGDRVQAGALMLVLDSTDLSAQIVQIEANLRVLQVQLEAAEKTLSDTRLLFNAEIAPRQQLEQAETQYRVLVAQIAQVEASLEPLHTNLRDTRITAPISGTIDGLNVNVGEMISPGMPVATINRLDPIEVHAQLTEKDVGRVDVGQMVEVAVTAVFSEPLLGRVVMISPIADARTKTYLMKVSLANNAGRLRVGMTATVELILFAERNTVVIPAEAVLTQRGEEVVFVLDEEEMPRLRPVTVGLRGDRTISILDGLSPGELVVVSGQHYISEGRPVTVVGGAD